jgi:hypothetical protein
MNKFHDLKKGVSKISASIDYYINTIYIYIHTQLFLATARAV